LQDQDFWRLLKRLVPRLADEAALVLISMGHDAERRHKEHGEPGENEEPSPPAGENHSATG
jgi:hypothetical protein